MPELSAAEKQKLTDQLTEGLNRLLNTLASVEGDQWTFKPSPDDWSILENLEHIVIVEGRVHGRIGTMPSAPPLETGVEMMSEEQAVAVFERRDGRVPAPAAVLPTGQWTPEDALEKFKAARAKTLELVDAPGLRGHVVSHPVCGPWDGYRWMLAAAAHANRHEAQIREVMSRPEFPAALAETVRT